MTSSGAYIYVAQDGVWFGLISSGAYIYVVQDGVWFGMTSGAYIYVAQDGVWFGICAHQIDIHSLTPIKGLCSPKQSIYINIELPFLNLLHVYNSTEFSCNLYFGGSMLLNNTCRSILVLSSIQVCTLHSKGNTFNLFDWFIINNKDIKRDQVTFCKGSDWLIV